MRKLRRVFLALAALCLLPLAGALLSAIIAGVAGCELSESGPQACEVLGVDIGGFLATLFVSGWLAMVSIPALMELIVLWGLIEGGVIWRKRRRARKHQTQNVEA